MKQEPSNHTSLDQLAKVDRALRAEVMQTANEAEDAVERLARTELECQILSAHDGLSLRDVIIHEQSLKIQELNSKLDSQDNQVLALNAELSARQGVSDASVDNMLKHYAQKAPAPMSSFLENTAKILRKMLNLVNR